MSLLGYTHYLLGSLPALSISSTNPLSPLTGLFVPSHTIPLLSLFFKYSFISLSPWLVELGAYEVSGWAKSTPTLPRPLLWYMFKLGPSQPTL